MSLYKLVRPYIFNKDPEFTHSIALSYVNLIGKLPFNNKVIINNPVEVMGIKFPNPIGCAAGLDKNGTAIDGLASLGFSFIEIGTVTPLAQEGNQKPRVFRLVEDEAIINRYGFNNAGIDKVIENVKSHKKNVILGINIGKNKDTSDSDAHLDYIKCMKKALPYSSYITINLSSPNTPGLRNLQHGEYLRNILQAVKYEQAKYNTEHNKYVPLVLKVSPDISSDDRINIASVLLELSIDGLIVSNTTIVRDNIDTDFINESGGLSGKPLFDKSLIGVCEFSKLLQGKIPIIASGGIDSVERAELMLKNGASLIQMYTALVYKGPNIVKEIITKLKLD